MRLLPGSQPPEFRPSFPFEASAPEAIKHAWTTAADGLADIGMLLPEIDEKAA
ncbi:MAG: hypothetical protein V2J20_04945 [Wenzhouxiangella sp.]|jgi:hypothetical protein|nr:hypothetical protein [Wenzhouxiangella sp.]